MQIDPCYQRLWCSPWL